MIGSRFLILIGCLLGLTGVGIGAMGAHSLPQRLRSAGFEEEKVSKKLDQCEIGVRYQMYHACAILAFGLAPITANRFGLRAAGSVMLLGVAMFSGGLYSMVFFDQIGHWSIVPIGGSILMLGWLIAGVTALLPGPSSKD